MFKKDTIKIINAISFAAERHRNQRRKGEGRAPYINHPVQVSQILSDCGEDDVDLLIAALLHDVIEDTTKNTTEIKSLSNTILDYFGQTVLNTVLEVSDDKSLPVEERKRLQVLHTPRLSERARKLKIADKISNLKDIQNDPPENWTNKRKLAYLAWAKDVVEGARGLNPKLDHLFDEVYANVRNHLQNT